MEKEIRKLKEQWYHALAIEHDRDKAKAIEQEILLHDGEYIKLFKETLKQEIAK